MNAKLLERMTSYRDKQGVFCSKKILSKKIKYQFQIIGQLKSSNNFIQNIIDSRDVQELLLIEARAARAYWHIFGKRIVQKVSWNGRGAHAGDVANKLLDIGYHYLANKLLTICQEINLPTELGFFHKAQSANTHPLVYDCMEWLRPIVVDSVLLKMIGKKKKKIETIHQKFIPVFISKIKHKFERDYFHRKLGYCVALEYWTKLVLLELMDCINTNKKYNPIFPSLRNETRCSCNKKPPAKQTV